jgi:UV DNA damage endonuclease
MNSWISVIQAKDVTTDNMKIGYPCINRSIGCQTTHAFRLKSYSKKRLIETVEQNLTCLFKILQFNARRDLLFFRITSDLVPFASHQINKFKWQNHFRRNFEKIGKFIRDHNMRISMHPDQFTLINSLDTVIFKRSIAELKYHAEVLDLMDLDATAKIQIHVGGVYKDKYKSMKRFVSRYHKVGNALRRRLVIENDEKSYTVQDCLRIHDDTGIPVLFDTFHHEVNNNGETIQDCLKETGRTWKARDGIPMIDYSHQKEGSRKGAHADAINTRRFRKFLEISKPYDFDIMLEIKDKERSAQKAARSAQSDTRFQRKN